MASFQFPESIRREYGACCLTNSYEEPNCRIDISRFGCSALATVHGDLNQRCSNHRRPARLCDRVIFGSLNEDFICAAEIKGGKNPEVPKAIRQIQGGLDLARSMLQSLSIEHWYPLLFSSGKMKGNDLRTLQTRRVSYGGKKKYVDRIDCGTSLYDFLVKQMN